MRKSVKNVLISMICMMLVILNSFVSAQSVNNDQFITISVEEVRYIDTSDLCPNSFFTFILRTNNESYHSIVWNDLPYVTKPNFSVTIPLSNEASSCYIEMQLLLTDASGTVPCDLTMFKEETTTNETSAKIQYDMHTGHWTGDDFLGDSSGYGRLNGCDDGSIYTAENDCELWFSIIQYDPDGDGIPTWMEEHVYDTDPLENNSGSDVDGDGVPIEWEWRWGYDPLVAEDHDMLDVDNDSINNIEEYLVSFLGSDPYRKDIFLELDWMDVGPNGEKSSFPDISKELLRNPFHRRNYVFHVDTDIYGGELITFDDSIDSNELLLIYDEYFIHNGSESWKRGIFHYGVYIYDCTPKGYAFSGDVDPHWGYHPGTNGFMISSNRMERNGRIYQPTVEYFYASATMHEMGHNFGFRYGDPFGVDAQLGKYPWQPMYYVYRNYKSIMNYRYTYKIFDYSDGINGFLDNDDWGTLDLSYFEYE